jgi:hypothetical protein
VVAGRRRIGLKLALSATALVSTLILDRALGWVGLPGEVPAYPVAPPHFEARIENLEYSYTRRTNDRGIRYRTIPLAKPAGVWRVVLVGDSFTEGACVEDPERWSERIEQRLAAAGGPAVELVNCGEAGTHPRQYAQTLVQLGLLYQPDAVVVGVYFDDVPNTPADLDVELALAGPAPVTGLAGIVRRLWPHAYALVASDLPRAVSRQPEHRANIVASARRIAEERGIDGATFERWLTAVPEAELRAVDEGLLTPGLVTHALSQPAFFYEGIGLETEAARAKLQAVTRLLGALDRLCRERGIRFGVVLMPSVHQFDPRSSETLMARVFAATGHPVRESWKHETTPLQSELASWAESRRVPFLDLVPVFRQAVASAEERLNFEIDPHWTPAGHMVASRAIQLWMEESGLLPGAGH